MKKLLFFLIAVCFAVYLPAQTTIAFQEDFESSTIGLITTADSAGFPTTSFNPWSTTTNLVSSGLKADSNKVQTGKVIYLTSNSFSTIGKSVVSLEFAQICKLYVSDGGTVEVSIDGGTTWVVLTLAQYQGAGNMLSSGTKFCDNSYSTDWAAGSNAIPTNAWWKNEKFNISAIAANQANVKIRFKYLDSGNTAGAGRYGWLLDDIKVLAANNELNAPRITFKTPILKDTLFVTGPFTVQAYVTDSAAITAVNLIYNVNGGSDITIPMINPSDSSYIADIPSYAYGSIIKYKVKATDFYGNISSMPSGYQTFTIIKGLPSIQIGTTATAGLFSPVYIASATSTYLYSYNACLFEKNEILSGGTIQSLEFNKTDVQGYSLGNATLKIYIKGTSQNYAPNTYAEYVNTRSGAIKVYENTAQNLNTAAGWQTFLCNTGSLFNYTGAENILIFIEWYRPGNATGAVNWQINTAVGKANTFYGAGSVPDLSNTTGQRANIKINFQSSIEAIDATLLNFASPTNPMTANVSTPVSVRIKNLGSSTLTEADVHWALDGIYQGMGGWTGSLQQDFVSQPVLLGNVNLNVGPHVLKAWTDSPNNVMDNDPTNDTIFYNFFACQNLTGIFTVGSPTSNFPTINDMYTAINNCGISGPVTFKLASGTYNQQLIFSLINNVSAINTLTFESASGNNNDVIFQYSSTVAADNYVLRFDASKYIKIKNMTFKNLGTTYGQVVELLNGASYNTLEGCKIQSQIGATSSTARGITNSTTTFENYNTIKNNEITGGYYGVYFYGTSANKEKGNVFEGNIIKDFYYYGLYMYYQDTNTAINNYINNSASSATVYAFYSYYCDNTTYLKNKIIVNGSGTNYCMYIYYNNTAGTGSSVIANNWVSQSIGTAVYGVYNYNSKNINYSFNSINVLGGTASYYAFYSTGATGIKLKNNIFVNKGLGYSLYAATGQIDTSNYNNFYSNGTNLAYWSAACTSLPALQAASGKDQNSMNVDPQYTSISDLHINNFSLINMGSPVPNITDDIDGEIRSNTPTIGSDEILIPSVDAGLFKINIPAATISVLNQNIKVTVKHIGSTPLTSATIRYSVNGVLQTPSYSYLGNLAQFAQDSVVIGNFTFNLGLNTLKVWIESPNNLPDVFASNDTISMSVIACSGPMSGSYTIGGTGANFANFNDAILILKSCGVNAPVVFNVNPGSYSEQFIIPAIPGTSAVNTVTFKSLNNDSTSVIIDAGTGVLGNFVAKFVATQYIKLEKMTLKNEVATGRVIDVSNGSSYITVANCILKSQIGATSSTAAVFYSLNASLENYLTIKNNQIIGGYYGIYMYGVSTTSKEMGHIIQNNTIKDFYYYAIYSYYQDGVTIKGNTIQNSSTSGICYGMYLYYNDNGTTIRNDIRLNGSTTNYGMYVYYNNSTTGSGLIANNFVSQSIGTAVYGIYNYYTSNMNYYYNSINVTGGTASYYSFYSTGGAGNNVVNNNFSNTGAGYAFYVSTIAGINISNYNNFYVTGINLAYWGAACTNLVALKALSSKDANSISTNPLFFGLNDLHTDNVALFSKGTTVAGVIDDIDGQIRPSIPCIGADQFTVLPHDAKLKSLYTFGKLPIDAGAPHQVKSIIRNVGINTLTNLTLTLNITGANTFTNTKTITLASGAEDTISFDNFTPLSLGLNNVKVTLPLDSNMADNELNFMQQVTDSTYAYADTTKPNTFLGFNTGSGLFLAKYFINGSKLISKVSAYITNSNTIGQRLYAVVLNQNGIILDTSYSKILTAADTNTWVSFTMLNPSASSTVNNFIYLGIAQTTGTGGYYPLGCQPEVPTRKGAFYYTTTMTGGLSNLTETTQFGRFMIQATLAPPAPKDASLAQIVSPNTGCSLTNETVSIKILNAGLDTIFGGQNTLMAYYALKSSTNTLVNIVSQQVTDTILPTQNKVFTFTTAVNMSITTADSNFKLVSWVNLLNDPYPTNDTLNKTVKSIFTPPTPVVTSPVNIIFNSSAILSAISMDTINWYANLTDTLPISTGSTYITPVLTDTTTYWVDAGHSAGNTAYVGPLNTSIGAGGTIGATSYNLIFDVLSPIGITIKNVDVYPATSGSAFVMVIKNSAGTIIQTYNGVTTTTGTVQTVNVNFVVPLGTNYTLGFTSGPSFYRNTAGATFPYTIPNVVSITATSFAGYPAYYYNAYNWQVSWGGGTGGCYSARVPVIVNVSPGVDATVTKILSPNTGCGLMNQTVQIRIKNRGNLDILSSQNSITANYGIKHNNTIVNIVSEPVVSTILNGDSILFTFTTTVSLPTVNVDSNYSIVAWTTLVNDLNIHNDTTIKVVRSKYTPLSPVVADQLIPYGTAATFTTVSNDSIYWFAHINDTIPIASGLQFTTPFLYDTTTYWVKAGVEGSGNNLGLTAISTHSGGGASTAGYGPELYNDGVIMPYGTVGTYIWGWTNTNGSIEYTWPTAVSFNKVVFYKDTRTMTTCTFQYWNGSSYVDFLSYNNPNADDSVTFPTITTTKLRFNTIAGAANPSFREIQVYAAGGCASPLVPVTASVSSIPALDIASTAITEPIGSVVSGVASPVKVALTNYGTSTVTSVTINWSVNGILQPPLPQIPINLLNGQTSAPIYLGDYTFAGGPSVIKAWTSLPNNLVDMFPVNDTVTANVMGCLTGTFTVGSGGTFSNFTAALNAINAVGICGNVIFDVLPGTYNEAITINQFTNSDPNNTITFRSQNGINTSVILTSAAGSSVVKLNGADYIRFEKITIQGSGAITSAVELSGGANNNIFDGNIIKMPLTTTSTYRVINSTNTALDNFNQFNNNIISGGYYSVYWYGSSALRKKGNQFMNNTINDFYYYGMYIYYNDSVTVTGNSISNASNSATVYGLYSYYTNSSIFTKNKLNITGSGTAYCMYMYYNNSTGGGSSLVANNFVSQSIGTAVYGIYNYYSLNVNYYHNSINVTGGTASYYAFYSTGGSGNNIVNNIFSNTGGGYAYYIGTPAGINTSNYNNFYATGSNLAYWTSAHTTLASLKTVSGKDQNSLSVNPNFFSTSNLHLVNFDLDGKGTPLAAITDDIDGDLRNVTIPDIGADEFNLPDNDAGIIAMTAPTNPTSTGVQDVKVVIKNLGVLNLTSANIYWKVNGILQPAPFAWTGNLITGNTDTVNLGTYNFVVNSAAFKVWSNLPNGVVDQLQINDTLSKTLVVCAGALAGNYTIGGTSANFQTITDAIQSLTYCGVNGAVTFNINQGSYNEQLLIPSVPGASSVNTITFKSVNNDSSSVVINYTPTSANDNYVVKLNNASYIRFMYLSLVNNTQNNMGRVVELTNASSNNVFSNNAIKSVPSTASTAAGIYSYNTKDEKNTFANNLITGGYYGIYLYGVGTAVGSKEIGNTIVNNIIKDFYYYGLYLYYQDSITVVGNTILNAANSATTYGMYSYYSDNNNYQSNKFLLNNSGTTYGMYIYYNNNAGGNGIIANNFLTQSLGTGTVYGIYNYYSTNMKYYYNSINVTAGGATNYSMYFTGGATNSLLNNSVVNIGGGYAIYAAATTSISLSNYNNFFVTGGSLGYWGSACSNLAAWKTASGKDINSVSYDPDYSTVTDLHVYTSALNNIGIPVSEVTTDIDGQTRSLTTPDIGADEYAPLPIDIGVKAILTPVISYTMVGGNVQIKCIIKNYGADSVANFNVVYKAGNAAAVAQFYPTYLLSNKSDTVTFTSLMPVVVGPFKIKVYTSIVGDGKHINDTLTINYFGVSVKNIPYAENFDNTTEEWFSVDPGTLWEKGVPSASVINTAHTAPNVWATSLNGNYSNSNVSILYTPIFNNATFKADTLRFWHWMDSEINKDGGSIEYQSNSTGPWTLLGSILADTSAGNWYNGSTLNAWTGTSAGWQKSVYKISDITSLGNTVQFRFVFNADAANNNYNGWAIDDFELTLAPIPQDGGVIAITSPAATSSVGDNVTVTVTVKNFGLDVLSNIPVKYQVGTGSVISDVMVGPLAPGATSGFTFTTQPFQVGNQSYTIRAYTEVFGDIYIQNDSTKKSVTVNPALNDVGITKIMIPGDTVGMGGTTSVQVLIKNFGSQTQTAFTVGYQRGVQTPVEVPWTGTLLAGATEIFTFPTPMSIPSGSSFSLAAYTKLTNDAYTKNDTLIKSIMICNIGKPGAITGLTNVNTGDNNVVYRFAGSVTGAVYYNWYYSGNDVQMTYDGNNKDTVKLSYGPAATGGTLSVKAFNGNCEGNASELIIQIGVGIDDINESNFWLGQNMPNPTIGSTNIEYNLPVSGEVKFDIMNLFGQKVYSIHGNKMAGKHLIDLDVKDLSSGVYYYSIEFKDKRLVKKMVVNK